MPHYEYLVVPSPKKGLKAKGVKGPEARFAFAIEEVMNEFAVAGWEYQRSDTLPSEERQGISGKTTTYRTVLIFRREVEPEPQEDLDEPELPAAAPMAPSSKPESRAETAAAPEPAPAPAADFGGGGD